ncbi:MAG TPA: hypothetical protein VEY10_17855 [Flavisolibacter sp.]|jgi:hypothetical protein|nr:hypothetical protein [Flavisolibacter sp.]
MAIQTIDLFGVLNEQDKDHYRWNHIPLSLQLQYNYLLRTVIDLDKALISDQTTAPNYYNTNFCLALSECGKNNNPDGGNDDTLLRRFNVAPAPCLIDFREATKYLKLPGFHYVRQLPDVHPIPVPSGHNGTPSNSQVNLQIDITSLTVGSVIWLYFYERMGIFKILGALLDDYNYKGKYPISSNVDGGVYANLYTLLMEHISLLYRQGLSSTLRDRICTYQRVLGVSIPNNQNIDSEKNEGLLKSFNTALDLMQVFYKAKQLAQAIQNTGVQNNGTSGVRSSVATQTAIRDTLQVLRQHLEAFEYGRNQVNTFVGIATVYTTICLIRLIKEEIGIPKQYNSPDEFIPAAYDILVLKRAVTPRDTNRFTIYDNCATYGYRLLTDIELLNINAFKTGATGTVFDLWLNDIEGIVEGYQNAYKSVNEPAAAMV